jgi:hypothetical protein
MSEDALAFTPHAKQKQAPFFAPAHTNAHTNANTFRCK